MVHMSTHSSLGVGWCGLLALLLSDVTDDLDAALNPDTQTLDVLTLCQKCMKRSLTTGHAVRNAPVMRSSAQPCRSVCSIFTRCVVVMFHALFADSWQFQDLSCHDTVSIDSLEESHVLLNKGRSLAKAARQAPKTLRLRWEAASKSSERQVSSCRSLKCGRRRRD